MANVLILSKQGDGIPVAIRLAKEKHNVNIYIKETKFKKSLEGFDNPKVIDKIGAADYDLIISDMVGLGNICEKLVDKGRLVIGGGKLQDKLELDRTYGIKVIESLTKLKVPKSKQINSKGELLLELQKASIPLVIKPLNNSAVDLTLVSNDDKNRSLLSIAKEWGDDLIPCVLQEKIDGIEISTEGWFNGEKFIKPFNHTFEKKRLMERDKGPQTGCMGNIVWPTEGDALTEMGLMPLEPLLKKAKYVGPIDINCILNNEGAYFLEFTTRFGYDAIQAFSEILKISLYNFLYGVAIQKGDLTKREEYLDLKAIAVRLTLPPYPNEGVEKWENIQVIDFEPPAWKHVWLADVKKLNNKFVCAGLDGVIGCMTAKGEDARECRRRVYRTIANSSICPDIQFRHDIARDFDDLKERFDRWCEHANS